jgi:hypothetical protein
MGRLLHPVHLDGEITKSAARGTTRARSDRLWNQHPAFAAAVRLNSLPTQSVSPPFSGSSSAPSVNPPASVFHERGSLAADERAVDVKKHPWPVLEDVPLELRRSGIDISRTQVAPFSQEREIRRV